MIDIGSNLTSESFKNDLPEVIQRAKKQGVSAIIATGTSAESSINAQQLAANYPQYLYSTAGVHPHEADHYSGQTEKTLSELLASKGRKQIVAVGETGLDYYRNFSTQDNQIKAFESQIQLAKDTQLPLFLHEREAFKDFYSIIKAHCHSLTNKAVVHCFTGNQEALKAYLDLGLYIGITGWISDKKRGENLRQIIRYAPLERLMIETDAPYLTPQQKGIKELLPQHRRNEPCSLKFTAEKLAECLDIKYQTLIEATTKTTCDFFNLDQVANERGFEEKAS